MLVCCHPLTLMFNRDQRLVEKGFGGTPVEQKALEPQRFPDLDGMIAEFYGVRLNSASTYQPLGVTSKNSSE